MNLNALLRDFQRLDPGAKMIFFGSLIALIAAFIPWYQFERVESLDFRIQTIPEVSNGFTRYPIFGFLSVIFAGSALLMFVQHFFGSRKTGGVVHGKAWMFLGAQALFALFIALFVYSSDMQSIPSAELRFGLFLSIFCHILILFGGYVEEKSRQKAKPSPALRLHPAPTAACISARKNPNRTPNNFLSQTPMSEDSNRQFYADNERSSEVDESTIDLSIAYELKVKSVPEEEWEDQGIAFFCNDCEKIVEAEKHKDKVRFTCPDCKGKNISFGTQKSVSNFFRLNESGKRKK